MDKKVIIGAGIAAIALFFLLKKKSQASQTPVIVNPPFEGDLPQNLGEEFLPYKMGYSQAGMVGPFPTEIYTPDQYMPPAGPTEDTLPYGYRIKPYEVANTWQDPGRWLTPGIPMYDEQGNVTGVRRL